MVVHTNPMSALQIRDLLANWAVEPVEVKRFQDVFRVKTADETYVLKPLNKSRRRARYIGTLTEYLSSDQGGDPLTPGLVRTKLGNVMFSESNRRHWVLCEWINGRTCKWDNGGDVLHSVRALARFHSMARGKALGPGEGPREYWFKWPATFTERKAEIESCFAEARRRVMCGEGTGFDQMVFARGRRQLEYAQRALDVLTQSDYTDLCRRYQRLRQVVHGDPAGRNFVVTEYGRTRIIDLETNRMDLPAADIAKFLRRALKNNKWSLEVAHQILDAYRSVLPIEPAMMPVIWAFIAFPTKFYRDVERYYHERPGWAYRRHLHKLTKHHRQDDRKHRFLDQFFTECLMGYTAGVKDDDQA